MNGLFLKNVILNQKSTCIRFSGGLIQKIGPDQRPEENDEILDCQGKLAVLPAFYNLHCHSAMSLMRGYADDMELFTWLSQHIWPLEIKLTPEDVYAGSRLAILEMIRSGTVFFADMYWFPRQTIRAAMEMGIRCCAGITYLSGPSQDFETKMADDKKLAETGLETSCDRIQLSYAPHAIYTVNGDDLRSIADRAKAQNVFLQIHLAETQKEFDDCLAQHDMTPVAWLDSLGVLTPKTVLAHSVYVTDHDLELIRDRGSVMVHNPCSNMKLSSGRFSAERIVKSSCKFALGTDGACSNNNLSMLDEMKTAALLAKFGSGDPTCFPAEKVFDMATRAGAEAMGLHAGVIEEGRLADCLLVDLDAPPMVPCHNLISNMVYAADPACIDSVICDGKFLMKHHHIEREEEILSEARKTVERLCSR